MAKIKAILVWNGDTNMKGGSYKVRFEDDGTIPAEWVTVGSGAIQEKAVMLELPEGWKKIETSATLNEYALIPPDGKCGGACNMYSVFGNDCEVKDGYIKANYTNDNDRPAWAKIKIVEA